MGDTDEHIDADDVQIDAQRVTVNTGWSARLAYWNTLGTVIGAFTGLASLVLSLILAYALFFH